MRRILVIIAVLLAGGSLAVAQERPPAPMPPPGDNGNQASPPAGQAPPETMAPQAAMGHAQRHPLRERFDAANTTHDGRLTLDQARLGRMPGVVAHFREIDAQGNGYITFDEWTSWLSARHRATSPSPP